jgi:DNA-binding NarL/FixJ family response regulator
LAEVECGADHGDLTRWLQRHRDKANFPPMGNRSRAGTIKVLLADDDRPFIDALSPLIERQPDLSVVGKAFDGLAAIELADELSPDAVVIDLHMPRLDGVTAVARLRRDHPSMCVIALTGDEAPALHRAVTEAGADAVLVKDEFVDVLVDRLAAAKAGIS